MQRKKTFEASKGNHSHNGEKPKQKKEEYSRTNTQQAMPFYQFCRLVRQISKDNDYLMLSSLAMPSIVIAVRIVCDFDRWLHKQRQCFCECECVLIAAKHVASMDKQLSIDTIHRLHHEQCNAMKWKLFC